MRKKIHRPPFNEVHGEFVEVLLRMKAASRFERAQYIQAAWGPVMNSSSLSAKACRSELCSRWISLRFYLLPQRGNGSAVEARQGCSLTRRGYLAPRRLLTASRSCAVVNGLPSASLDTLRRKVSVCLVNAPPVTNRKRSMIWGRSAATRS